MGIKKCRCRGILADTPEQSDSLDLTGLEALRTHIGMLGSSVHFHSDSSDVSLPHLI